MKVYVVTEEWNNDGSYDNYYEDSKILLIAISREIAEDRLAKRKSDLLDLVKTGNGEATIFYKDDPRCLTNEGSILIKWPDYGCNCPTNTLNSGGEEFSWSIKPYDVEGIF